MAISVVINTYNAEKHLRRVLESVKCFDEIVVCDMESSDSTLSIAQDYGCKIVTYPKGNCNIVEPARNFAIQSASHEWVLVLDADELVSPQLRDWLYAQTTHANPPKGIFIARCNYFMGQFMHAHYPDYILRFFCKSVTNWPPVIHAAPEVDGKVAYAPKKKELSFIHLADESMSDRLRKTDVYTDYECEKRKDKAYGAAAFFLRPLHRFFKSYVIKGGWRDGVPGFVSAAMEANYQIVMLSKLREKKRRHDD